MAVIQVLEPGMFTTVQDLGREGFGPMGVSASGAADALSLRVGNRLVGNAEGAAGLEMTLAGGAFAFPDSAVVALTGADFAATVDGASVEMWSSCEVRAGQVLRLAGTRDGARCYLCVRGGIDVPMVMGSASTHVLSGLGGFVGRALRNGDVLQIAALQHAASRTPGRAGAQHAAPLQRPQRRLSHGARELMRTTKTLRVTAGPQSAWFSEEARKTFFAGAYRVTEESNRMGLRLAGPAIEKNLHAEMISEGVTLGAIQVPESGMPIILFVEQQTTGGYPKIANVIAADFHSLGQLRPRDEVRFELVHWETARALLLEQEELLAAEEQLFG